MTSGTNPDNDELSTLDTELSGLKDVIKAFEQMFPLSQAAMAIFTIQVVENILESALTSKLTIPSNTFDDRLFKGYGPLSTFNAKIDMARALEIVDEKTYNTLRILKSIRNEVAHPDTASFPKFETEEIINECRKLPGYIDDENCFKLFINEAASIMVSIDNSKEMVAFTEEMRGVDPTFVQKSP